MITDSKRNAKDTGCIYMFKCLISGKAYIGQTRRKLADRAWQHLRAANTLGIKTRFYSAIRKHGEENFILGVIEDNIPKNLLNEKEIFYIEKYGTYNKGYNATPGGFCPSEFTEERRRKIGEKSKGRTLSDTAKKKIGDTHRGKIMTEGAKEAISNKMKVIAKEGTYESRFNNGVGVEAPSFKPWWFEIDGYRVNVTTMTIKQYAELNGLSVSNFTTQFNSSHKGKLVIKGMRFGYIGEVYE